MELVKETIEFRPQEGKQTDFLASVADIVVYGGAAGGGKTRGILMVPLNHLEKKQFGAVIFRKTSPMIFNEGGMWDEANNVYPYFNAVGTTSNKKWVFPSGMRVTFAHLQHETNLEGWKGAQIPFLGFDEITHFTEREFFYLLARNRTTTIPDFKPFVRATTNPDSESWVRKFIDWWIDPATGLAIDERSGVIRWFFKIDKKVNWADSKEELAVEFEKYRSKLPVEVREKFDFEASVKSFTFIKASIFDNKALMEADPGYIGNLMNLDMVDQEQLLGGNWNIKREAGTIYNRTWYDIVDSLPRIDFICRGWDFAATEKELTSKGKDKNDPDFTAGVLIGYSKATRKKYVLDMVAIQGNPAEVEKLFYQTCVLDKERARRLHCHLKIRWEVEPASAAKRESEKMVARLHGYDADGFRSSGRGDKYMRNREYSRQSFHKEIDVLEGGWNDAFLGSMHAFGPGQEKNGGMFKHDDPVDAFFYANLGLDEDIEYEDYGNEFVEFD